MTVDTTIYANAGVSTQQSAAPKKETGVSTIDQAGFLKLMTAQMQMQDPFEPMDNNQMVQQMATFTQLENQTAGNKTLQTISDSLTGTRLSDAASWIGKSMLVKGDIATPDRAGAYGGEVTIDAKSDDVQIDLIDGAGKTVTTLEMGARSAGTVAFYWDGKDAEGKDVGGGALQMRVRGAKTTAMASWTSIVAVQSPASGTDAQLITPLGNFKPTDALRLG